MPKSTRRHPPFYYTIRDAIIARMGPSFSEEDFKANFPSAARPHSIIPYSDGYLAIRRIIKGLVKDRMRKTRAAVPKQQEKLQLISR